MGLVLELTGDSDLSGNRPRPWRGVWGDPGLAALFLTGEKPRSVSGEDVLPLYRGEVSSLCRAPRSELACSSM